jgi:hypothetical protein
METLSSELKASLIAAIGEMDSETQQSMLEVMDSMHDSERAAFIGALAGMDDHEKAEFIAAMNSMGHADRMAYLDAMAGLDVDAQRKLLAAVDGMSEEERSEFLRLAAGMDDEAKELFLKTMSSMSSKDRAAFMDSIGGMSKENREKFMAAMKDMDQVERANFLAAVSGLDESDRIAFVKTLNGMSKQERRGFIKTVASMDAEGREALVRALDGMSKDEISAVTEAFSKMDSEARKAFTKALDGMSAAEVGAFAKAVSGMDAETASKFLNSAASMSSKEKTALMGIMASMDADARNNFVNTISEMGAEERATLVTLAAGMDKESQQALIASVAGMTGEQRAEFIGQVAQMSKKLDAETMKAFVASLTSMGAEERMRFVAGVATMSNDSLHKLARMLKKGVLPSVLARFAQLEIVAVAANSVRKSSLLIERPAQNCRQIEALRQAARASKHAVSAKKTSNRRKSTLTAAHRPSAFTSKTQSSIVRPVAVSESGCGTPQIEKRAKKGRGLIKNAAEAWALTPANSAKGTPRTRGLTNPIARRRRSPPRPSMLGSDVVDSPRITLIESCPEACTPFAGSTTPELETRSLCRMRELETNRQARGMMTDLPVTAEINAEHEHNPKPVVVSSACPPHMQRLKPVGGRPAALLEPPLGGSCKSKLAPISPKAATTSPNSVVRDIRQGGDGFFFDHGGFDSSGLDNTGGGHSRRGSRKGSWVGGGDDGSRSCGRGGSGGGDRGDGGDRGEGPLGAGGVVQQAAANAAARVVRDVETWSQIAPRRAHQSGRPQLPRQMSGIQGGVWQSGRAKIGNVFKIFKQK